MCNKHRSTISYRSAKHDIKLALNAIESSEKVILVSDCSYMKIGLRFLINEKVKSGIKFEYLEFPSDNSIADLLSHCRDSRRATLFCDSESRFFSCFIEGFESLQDASETKPEWMINLIGYLQYKKLVNNKFCTEKLSAVENQIVKLLMNEWKPKKISEATGISIRNISIHKRNAMKKMNVRSLQALYKKYHEVNRFKYATILLNSIEL